MLTRAAGLNATDQRFFESRGYQTVSVPLTEIKLNPITPAIQKQIYQANWLFFTSQAPVKAVLQYAKPQVKIAVIGKKTAAVVNAQGFQVTFISPKETKQALLESWQACYIQPTTIFYPKSQLADEQVETFLAKQHQVESFVAYCNQLPKQAPATIDGLIKTNQIQAAYLTSPSAWQRLAKLDKKVPIELIAIGPTTQQAIEADGYQATLIEKF